MQHTKKQTVFLFVYFTLIFAFIGGCATVDTEAVIEEAIAIEMEMAEIETDRDRAFVAYESLLDRVEKGPQMLLNVHLRLADTQEGNGWTVEAQRTREEAYEEFNTNPLVATAIRAEYRYYDLADLWVSKNLALSGLLARIHRRSGSGQRSKAARRCSSESGIMVL